MRLDAGKGVSLCIGELQMAAGRHPEAVTAFRGALKLIGPLVDKHPAEPKYASQLIEAYHQLARCYSSSGQLNEAEAAQREAVARCERLAASHPQEPGHRRGLANAYNNLAVHCEETGRPSEAVILHGKNVAIFQQLLDEHPDNIGIRIDLARGLCNLGVVCSQTDDRAAEAADYFRRAAPHYEFVTRNHPGESLGESNGIAVIHNNLGYIHATLSRLSEAIDDFRRSEEHYEALLATHPESTEVRHDCSVMLFNLGSTCELANRRFEAEAPYQRAKANFQEAARAVNELAWMCPPLSLRSRQDRA